MNAGFLKDMLLAFALVTGPALGAGASPATVTDPNIPRHLPGTGPVQVQWTDPSRFSDILASGNRWEARRGNWVWQLAEYLRARAVAQLPPGERLDVTITDIQRAGGYESWHGPQAGNVRIVRDIHPPRISLVFKRYDAQGRIIGEGERRLTDYAFMQNSIGRAGDSDPLRYEKRLIDDWLRQELKTGRQDGESVSSRRWINRPDTAAASV
ncbi:MAG: DUF3016 domain-containing protein [Xanthomonadaceae bacterium]|jgi:hypothetical protein|nr:DUF3016 domain-containing protein [Xanthomonadaceae bacterium]